MAEVSGPSTSCTSAVASTHRWKTCTRLVASRYHGCTRTLPSIHGEPRMTAGKVQSSGRSACSSDGGSAAHASGCIMSSQWYGMISLIANSKKDTRRDHGLRTMLSVSAPPHFSRPNQRTITSAHASCLCELTPTNLATPSTPSISAPSVDEPLLAG